MEILSEFNFVQKKNYTYAGGMMICNNLYAQAGCFSPRPRPRPRPPRPRPRRLEPR